MMNLRLYGGWAAYGPDSSPTLGLRWFPYPSWSEELLVHVYYLGCINWSMDAWEFA